jgi:hypothetical protein
MNIKNLIKTHESTAQRHSIVHDLMDDLAHALGHYHISHLESLFEGSQKELDMLSSRSVTKDLSIPGILFKFHHPNRPLRT